VSGTKPAPLAKVNETGAGMSGGSLISKYGSAGKFGTM
jgi:hypothetical protein